MVNSVELGAFLRKVRKELNMTINYVADVIDRDEKTIRNIEQGKSKPEIDTMMKLFMVYNLPVNEVLRFYDPGEDMLYSMRFYNVAKHWKHAISNSNHKKD